MVYEADIVSLFRTLLILAAIYYGFRFLFRVVVPYLLARWVRKAASNMQQQQYSGFGKSEDVSVDKGKVSISKPNPKSSSKGESDADSGEYIDFEEV